MITRISILWLLDLWYKSKWNTFQVWSYLNKCTLHAPFSHSAMDSSKLKCSTYIPTRSKLQACRGVLCAQFHSWRMAVSFWCFWISTSRWDLFLLTVTCSWNPVKRYMRGRKKMSVTTSINFLDHTPMWRQCEGWGASAFLLCTLQEWLQHVSGLSKLCFLFYNPTATVK